MSTDEWLRELERALKRAEDTDMILNPALGIGVVVLGPLASASVSVIATVCVATASGASVVSAGGTALTVGTVVLFAAFLAVNAALFYILIRRRNKHFERSSELFRIVSEILYRTECISKSCYLAIFRKVKDIEELGHLDEVLWIFLGTITFGVAYLYVAYRLMRDFYLHEARESAIASLLADELDMCISFFRKIPYRNFGIHILIVVFFPILYPYLVYILIKDPNNHFLEHRRFERTLVEKLFS
ncbi:hypothetical protein [Methanopyrus kandleri]|uniref:Uncharacterized membrane protein specific for M.kandleri, MK-4 family n=2 Tax=Methanopyrus kandleri TaxID=2320 RepID=Q8TYR7_METKA|nr:hypothetical protein [Methanopyrus kandleri]AAM01442.1 Uncharacterized membrane protein specific for M.kandleri, MK-4 family [Methanopyrus kandleri AV19]HII70632.1 hypothetical protein [Methanopyrus kandleri]